MIRAGRLTPEQRLRFEHLSGQRLETDEETKRSYLALLWKLAGEPAGGGRAGS